MKIKCVVIDDEPVAVQGMEEYISKVDFLELSSSFTSCLFPDVAEAVENADVLLLDIQMPELTGNEFLKSLQNPPMAIFTTAFPHYALEGFELNVIDYLVKPIQFHRFFKAANKVRDFYQLRQDASTGKADYFFVKVNNQQERVLYDEILFVEAMQHFVVLQTTKRKMVTYMTISNMEKLLPANKFLRVHKSYIIALDKVQSFTPDRVQIGPSTIPISRVIKKNVAEKLLTRRGG